MMPQAIKKMEKNPIENIPPHRRALGRPKGVNNQKTVILKDALMQAAAAAGDEIDHEAYKGLVGYLLHLAMNKPELFAPLLGKVIPLQVTGTASDGALEIRWLPPQEPPKVIEHEEE
jgi:sarcosine oxidase gamma subunit